MFFCEICEEDKDGSDIVCRECSRRVCEMCFDTNACVDCANGVHDFDDDEEE